ncbi:hypothetical protein Clacol_001241 [Clathrus columnatus]|uniref:BTB domain-containing protein n=1 Tax=Clathrus columnatus TaxID=1419009 RepID=A0AAV5A1D8_9AGAM|nr:hypothetical protein Clacol_001241 [Clathrus columnatus]
MSVASPQHRVQSPSSRDFQKDHHSRGSPTPSTGALMTPPHSPPTSSEDGQSHPKTPPQEHPSSTTVHSENTLISISTTFFPGAQINQSPSDLVLVSSDSVFFYVHTQTLLDASQNAFNRLLPATSLTQDSEAILPLPESSDVLNVVLHTIYNLSCAHYAPTVHTLTLAVRALKVYGAPLDTYIAPSTPLFTLLLANAPASPMSIYALAGEHDLHHVAVSASPHLLSFPLPTLTDEMAQQMGAVYLKKLFFLHLGRSDALKRLLLPPPHPHSPTHECDFTEQKKLTRAWALASAYLAWDSRPDMPGSTLESALSPLGERLWCDLCREALQERIRTLIIQWSVVKD